MSQSAIFEERKVQEAIQLLETYPGMKKSVAARQTRFSYDRLRRRLSGIRPSNLRGGHNKKFVEPHDQALKDFLLFCHDAGQNAGVIDVVSAANILLRLESVYNVSGDFETVTRRWAEAWVERENEFIETIRSRPFSALRRAVHNREEMMLHFEGYRIKWGILDDDIYNVDETGCQIGVTFGGRVLVPTDTEKVFSNNLDNRELVTAVECFSATGYHVPAMLIFKGANHLRKYFEQTEQDGKPQDGNNKTETP